MSMLRNPYFQNPLIRPSFVDQSTYFQFSNRLFQSPEIVENCHSKLENYPKRRLVQNDLKKHITQWQLININPNKLKKVCLGIILICYLNICRFLNLEIDQKQEFTQIEQQQLIQFILFSYQKSKNNTFKFSYNYNVSSSQSFSKKFKFLEVQNTSGDSKINSEKFLIDSVRYVCTGTEKIFFCKQSLSEGKIFLQHLQQISNYQIFQYSQKQQKKNEVCDNPLWFSHYSFNTLGEWLCSAVQKSILNQYFNYKKGKIILSSSLLYGYKLLEFYMKLENSEKKKILSVANLRVLMKQKIQLKKIIELKLQEITPQSLRIIKISFKKLQELYYNMPNQQQKQNLKIQKKKSKTKKKQKHQKDITKKSEIQIKQLQQSNQNILQISQYSQSTSDKSDLKQNIINKSQKQQTLPLISIMNQVKNQHQQQPKQQDNLQILKVQQNSELIEITKNILKQNNQKISENQSISTQKKNKKKYKKKKNNTVNTLTDLIFQTFLEPHVQKFNDNISISANKLLQARIVVFQRIRYFISKLYGQYYNVEIKLFGSNAMGLSLPSSDIDILLGGFNLETREQSVDLLQKISLYIRRMRWVKTCIIYPHAKIPILKLEIDPNIRFFQMHQYLQIPIFRALKQNLQVSEYVNEVIKVDITIEANLEQYSHKGCESTDFMKSCMNKTSHLNSLVLIIKYILSCKGYNESYKGGLSSYSIFLMAASFLKEFKNEYIYLSQILFQFLKFYSQQFNNQQQGISYYQDKSCYFKLEQFQNTSLLNIFEPLHGKMISGSSCQYNLIKSQFKKIKDRMLNVKQSIKAQIQKMSQTQQKILGDKKKNIQKWLKRYQKNNSMIFQNLIAQ